MKTLEDLARWNKFGTRHTTRSIGPAAQNGRGYRKRKTTLEQLSKWESTRRNIRFSAVTYKGDYITDVCTTMGEVRERVSNRNIKVWVAHD